MILRFLIKLLAIGLLDKNHPEILSKVTRVLKNKEVYKQHKTTIVRVLIGYKTKGFLTPVQKKYIDRISK